MRRYSRLLRLLLHQLKGDLDWIVMKCLEKDRTRRYETANGLAADLKRHLNNEPVLARPPSAAYKFQKAFRRNKLVFSAVVAVAGALVVGISVSVWQAARATRAKIVADAASAAAKASEQKARDAEAGQTLLREQAEAQALAARRIAYSSDINLAQQALAMNNLGRAQMLLNRQKPGPGQADLRGWEWRYLWSQTRADEHEMFFAGTNRLRNMSFSGDGRLLAWEFEGEMVVTDLISRRTVLQRTNSWLPAFAHQAVLLAFVSTISPTNDAITLLDIATKKETQIETSWAYTRWMGFTPDDRRLLTVSRRPDAKRRDKFPLHLTAWEVSSGKLLWQRPLSAPETGLGRPYALSPDGNLFAAATPDGRFQVLDSASGDERISVKATPERVTALAFSPDGKAVLSGAGYTDSAIQIWDSHSGTNLGALEGHRSWVSDLVFTPDATRLISSSADQTVRLWDWSTRKAAGILRGHLDGVDGVALAPDGRTLASRCIDGSVYLWDLTKPSRKVGYETSAGRLETRDAVFTPDSRSILAIEPRGGAILLDAVTLKETRRLRGNSTNRYAITISPDASRVIYGGSEGRVHVWDVPTGMENTNFIAASGPIFLWLTADGKSLMTFLTQRSTSDVLVDVWSTDSWKRQGSIKIKRDDVLGIHTPSLPNSLVIRTPGALQFFDVTKPDQSPKQIEGQGEFYDLAASPDGRTVAVAYGEGFVRLWDLTTLQKVDSVKGFLLGAHSVAFSPDGKRLAAGSNGQEAVKLWDAETRQEVLTLSGEGSMFQLLKFSPDGRFLLAVNAAGLAHLWSAPTWEEIAVAEAKDQKESRQP